jgi:hypothetical protein
MPGACDAREGRGRAYEVLLTLDDVLELGQPFGHVGRAADRDRFGRRVQNEVELLALAKNNLLAVAPEE